MKKKKKKNGRMRMLVMLHDDNRRDDEDEEGGMKRVTRPRARLDFFGGVCVREGVRGACGV